MIKSSSLGIIGAIEECLKINMSLMPNFHIASFRNTLLKSSYCRPCTLFLTTCFSLISGAVVSAYLYIGTTHSGLRRVIAVLVAVLEGSEIFSAALISSRFCNVKDLIIVMGEWQHGLFGCFDNFGVCIVTYFLPCYTAGKNAEAVGSSCLLCGLVLFIPIADVIFPATIRQKNSRAKGNRGKLHRGFTGTLLLHVLRFSSKRSGGQQLWQYGARKTLNFGRHLETGNQKKRWQSSPRLKRVIVFFKLSWCFLYTLFWNYTIWTLS